MALLEDLADKLEIELEARPTSGVLATMTTTEARDDPDRR